MLLVGPVVVKLKILAVVPGLFSPELKLPNKLRVFLPLERVEWVVLVPATFPMVFTDFVGI